MNSDLSDAVRAAMDTQGVTLTRILEEGARLWLAQHDGERQSLRAS